MTGLRRGTRACGERALLDPVARAAAQQEADAFVRSVHGVVAVVVATADGFDIAACVKGAQPPRSIAALASAIAALGDVVSQEAGLGASRVVIVTTATGFAVVHGVRRRDVNLALSVFASDRAVLDEVSVRSAGMAHRLSDAVTA